MSVALLTICLNEMEFLPKLWEQHQNWPGLRQWIFVEACDRAYAAANPAMATEHGLSVDGTGAFLRSLSDRRVTYIPHGFSGHADPARGKIAMKQRALAEVRDVEFFIILDADEFYTQQHQAEILDWMRHYPDHQAFSFHRREIWRPPAFAEYPLFTWEVAGGFWGIPCAHWYRWSPGVRFDACHNTPSDAHGRPLNDTLLQLNERAGTPQMIHLGFAACEQTRLAKNHYYAHRGEQTDPQRSWYVQSRDAWQHWRPGQELPRGAEVLPYEGPIPEVFQ